jgi:NADPH:quinone reductase-like Zn-dependent oxidoreductase
MTATAWATPPGRWARLDGYHLLDVGANVVCVGSGGFAEQVVLPTNRLFRLPDGVPVERSATTR